MRISDWSSDVCSSDLEDGGEDILRRAAPVPDVVAQVGEADRTLRRRTMAGGAVVAEDRLAQLDRGRVPCDLVDRPPFVGREGFLEPGVVGRLRQRVLVVRGPRSEEHTSELQSLMRSSYAVFCLQKKTQVQH